MLSLSTLYTGKEDFKSFIALSQLDQSRESLIRIYTAGATKEQAVQIAQAVKAVVPNGKILGASASGVILKGVQYAGDTLVVVEQFAEVQIETAMYRFAGREPEEVAEDLYLQCRGRNVGLVHILMDDHYTDVYRFVESVNALDPNLHLTGGIAGDVLPLDLPAYVFNEDGAPEKTILTARLQGKLWVTSAISLTSEPISPVYTITKCQGSRILEIDRKPALLWCQEQLGLEDFSEYSDWQLIAENDTLIRFPFILEGHGGSSRFIKYEGGHISLYFSQLDENMDFRIGYTSPTKCVQESFDNCRQISQTPVESLFCYTCLFRKLYLENCAEWELRPFLDHGVCGAFMMGEIGWLHGRNEFLNGACALVGVAEKSAYISPDFSVFEDLYKIKDDSNKLNSLVLRKQSAAMSKENQDLLQELLQQQDKAKAQLYTDPVTGVKNAIKFAQDNLSCSFDKLCLVQVENSSLILSRFGPEHYHQVLRRAIGTVRAHLEKMPEMCSVNYYTLNESLYFMAAGPQIGGQEFVDICRSLYEKYQFMDLGGKDSLIVNRFVVVLDQKNMLEQGLAILKNQKDMQSHFLISSPSQEDEAEIEQETEMLHLLGQVLEHDWVVPYFQGIRDNQTGRIDKYEALMRIRDQNGRLYLPGQFMNTAKKYHIYSALSRLMLEKVFNLFAGRSEVVSINLSYYDVALEELREYILGRLLDMERADNFVFEILEDEEFRDMGQLRSFVEQVRAYGAQMAVDDFGSGYSNFLEIVRLEPDYIKVDGSIVSSICKDEASRKVLAAIVGLAAQLGAKTVAEFVENYEIQEYMEKMGVHYSQGFYYSVPKPFAEALGEK